MTENKTSQAVDKMLSNIQKAIDNPRIRIVTDRTTGDFSKLKAIAAKYRTMESCLELLAAHGCHEWDVAQAKQALSFDPLSQ